MAIAYGRCQRQCGREHFHITEALLRRVLSQWVVVVMSRKGGGGGGGGLGRPSVTGSCDDVSLSVLMDSDSAKSEILSIPTESDDLRNIFLSFARRFWNQILI